MPGKMILRIWDVEHGGCTMLHHTSAEGVHGRLAMIDSGDTPDWTPSGYIRRDLSRPVLDYLFITYHFASQHFGVLSLYRVRAGRVGSGGLRRLDRVYALIVGGALVMVAEVVAGTVFFIDVWVDPWLDSA